MDDKEFAAIRALLLPAGESHLALEWDDNGWCTCTFVASKHSVYLDAETTSFVIARMIRALSTKLDATERTRVIAGFDARYALILMDGYYAMYLAPSGEGMIVLWQDAKTAEDVPVAQLHLTPEDRRQWIDELSRLRDELKVTRTWLPIRDEET